MISHLADFVFLSVLFDICTTKNTVSYDITITHLCLLSLYALKLCDKLARTIHVPYPWDMYRKIVCTLYTSQRWRSTDAWEYQERYREVNRCTASLESATHWQWPRCSDGFVMRCRKDAMLMCAGMYLWDSWATDRVTERRHFLFCMRLYWCAYLFSMYT